MWTLAASRSAQSQSLTDSLHRETKAMIEALGESPGHVASLEIEQVQAWILLAIYEFMFSDYRQAWIITGRALRLVQLMRLNEIDNSDIMFDVFESSKTWTFKEMKRRTFWMAYAMDAFVNICNGYPLTLSEEGVCWSPSSLSSPTHPIHIRSIKLMGNFGPP
jgi:hypothetical protein